ncbi:hypothetical protein ACFX12_044761 [Malus domestica]
MRPVAPSSSPNLLAVVPRRRRGLQQIPCRKACCGPQRHGARRRPRYFQKVETTPSVCSGLKPWVSVVLFLIREKSRDDSKWRTYLDILPESTNSIVFCADFINHSSSITTEEHAYKVNGAAGLEWHELQFDPDHRVRFRGLHGRSDNREPPGDGLSSGDFLDWDFGGSDDLGAEDIFIFNLKLEVSHRVSHRDKEVLLPLRVLGVSL